MIICHIAPFAPNRCGLYEAARDMARADIVGGNEVIFVDAGITINGERQEPVIGQVDDRAGFKIVSVNPDMISEADVIIMHTGCSDNWIVKNQAPLIWAVHGRPLACFRPEIQGKMNSYSLYKHVAEWKRTKKMLYFWPEFKNDWSVFVPENKNLCLDYPVVDSNRFSPQGQSHILSEKGKYNLLVCDSEREDIGLYELVVGCIEACKKIKCLKIHFFGFDFPLPQCWDILLGKLKEVGGLGELQGRVTNMELVYRAMDGLISPNRIITRTIAEAISCHVPVITEYGCKVSNYWCNMALSNDVATTIQCFIDDLEAGANRKDIEEKAKLFSMKSYSKKMNEIYKEVLK